MVADRFGVLWMVIVQPAGNCGNVQDTRPTEPTREET